MKRAKVLNLEDQLILLAKTILIYNSRIKIFPDKHFLQKAIQNLMIKLFKKIEKLLFWTFFEHCR